MCVSFRNSLFIISKTEVGNSAHFLQTMKRTSGELTFLPGGGIILAIAQGVQMSQRFWSVRELAERAGISGARVRQLIDENRVPAEKVGQTWVLTEQTARQFLADRGVIIREAEEQSG